MSTLRLATVISICLAILQPPTALAQDDSQIAKVIDEGVNHSQLERTAYELIDQIGARLTNSSGMRRAENWAANRMREIGLVDVHKEGFEFGPGWEVESIDLRMIQPKAMELTATPVAWTPGSQGRVEGRAIIAPMSKISHFKAYHGQLANKIVFIDLPGIGDEPAEPPFRRYEARDFAERDNFSLPRSVSSFIQRRMEAGEFVTALDTFLRAEGALAWVRKSRRDGKLLHGEGYVHWPDQRLTVPGIELAAEDYRRVARMEKMGDEPRLAINAEVKFLDTDLHAYNILGEIRGTDPSEGYILAGAHLDSWAAGDGAVDNGAGSVALLEAARILTASRLKPKRTIRFVLWSGEEQGLVGSLAYVRRHLVTRNGEDQYAGWELYRRWSNLWPITAKAGRDALKAYFNLDSGSGKIRGINAEGDVGAARLLGKWLAPFSKMGANNVVARSASGTDHEFFQAVGAPGYDFIQDPLDYNFRLHHTNVDTYDHLRLDDLKQAATVMAGVLLAAANDAETIPEQPLPSKASPASSLEWSYPGENEDSAR